jgi:hypothetical protein
MLSYSYDWQHVNKAVYFQMPHLQSKVHLWKYVEIVQHSIENQKSALSRFRLEVETEHSNTIHRHLSS